MRHVSEFEARLLNIESSRAAMVVVRHSQHTHTKKTKQKVQDGRVSLTISTSCGSCTRGMSPAWTLASR